MTLVTTTIADDDAPSPAMGDLGKFRIKKLKKLVKPLMSIAKPLLSMGQGGGLLTAMGPWGWAAGAALAAGGALAAKHRKKKQKAKQRQAEQTAMEPPQTMPAPAYEYPPAITEQPAEAMPIPDGYSAPSSDMPGPGAMTLPESPPAEWSPPGTDVATPYPVAEQSPEIQAVLDPEMPPAAVDGLAADGQPTAPLDWQTIAFIAGLGLGGWWLLSKHKPTRTKRR